MGGIGARHIGGGMMEVKNRTSPTRSDQGEVNGSWGGVLYR
jgi:hypothetical protein